MTASNRASSDSLNKHSVPGTARILVADDHELVRAGLRFVLEWVPGWKVCGEASNGADAVELASLHRPHVAIVDLDLPVMTGLDAIRAIRRLSPETAILALAEDGADASAARAREAGAARHALKTRPTTEIVAAMRSLVDEVTRANGLQPVRRADAPRLTTRELEVVRLLAVGSSNLDAGRALGIAPTTVETHRTNIMRKLSVDSIVGLVHYAIREEIIRV